MTRSVAELQDELQRETGGLVTSPQAGTAAAMAPAARLGWLKQALTELGIESGFLADADAFAARASAMRHEAVMAQQQAQLRRAAAVNTLGRDQAATLAEAVELWQAQGPWLDLQPGQTRPVALQLAEDAARLIESEISMRIYAHTHRLWDLAQRKAKEIVAEVASLPAMPRQLWEVGNPSAEFARWREHKATYGTLTAAYTDFELCHAIDKLCRDHLGYGYNSFPQGSTRAALWLRNWRKELGDSLFARQPGALKLRYALDHGFGPGLWAPNDVEDSTPRDRSFGGRLKNLGVAVGIPQSFPAAWRRDQVRRKKRGLRPPGPGRAASFGRSLGVSTGIDRLRKRQPLGRGAIYGQRNEDSLGRPFRRRRVSAPNMRLPTTQLVGAVALCLEWL
jgi:hypothetical protein